MTPNQLKAEKVYQCHVGEFHQEGCPHSEPKEWALKRKKLLDSQWNTMTDLLDKHFPKGESKERGEAIVLIAEIYLMLKNMASDELTEELKKSLQEFKEGKGVGPFKDPNSL